MSSVLPPILDATCGARRIWFDKNNPAALYVDKRTEEYHARFGANKAERHCVVSPDIQCSFTDLPFPDESFYLVVFDPPHLTKPDSSWLQKSYGVLDENWQETLRKGFDECMRVLKPNGTLIFKWSEIQINTADVIKAIGKEPLFGHKSGRKMNTHWMTFMKEDA